MSKLQRNVNLAAVALPFIGVVVAIVVLWDRGVDAIDLSLMVVMYVLTALGITVGFHRMLTHRSFQTSKAVEYGFAILGSMAVQGPVISWVADHRKHHAHADEEGDPHSPHVGHGSGLRGLWHAHIGWLLETQGTADYRQYAPDLREDPGMRAINRNFPLFVAAGLAIPFAAGYVLHGFSLSGALTALLWAGFVRIFFFHHVTWSINSVCHFFGRRRFEVDDHSTNVPLFGLLALGEGWHNNHHAFPRSASHGLTRWELDPSAMVIGLMEKLGLARNVVRISPERQAQRMAAGPRADIAA
jgi:stearoyl-CoA desaturase (Delta-9 desaturase)